MKKTICMLMGGLLVSLTAVAQDGGASAPPVVAPPAEETTSGAETAPRAETLPAAGAVAGENPDAEAVNPIEEADGGFLIKDASLNDIFQLLAKRGEKQYFHNNKLNTEEFKVTGHLNADTDPLTQMEELAFQYGLRMYVKGNTVYAMMSDQLDKLPSKEWTYSLRYLRPTDIEQIKALIQPMLSVGRGIVNFEPKTNTIIVIDTTHHIEMVEGLLRKIDKPKGQILVEVKVLNVNSTVGENIGIDWSSSLGEGVSVSMTQSMNSLFGIPTNKLAGNIIGGEDYSEDVGPSSIILNPVQLSAVLTALSAGGMTNQKSNPVVITEDNEKASFALIDRYPIITSTSTANSSGGNPTVTEEVRYKIDESDSTDPETTREIGVTMSMTPSLLPDGTIRMKMRPRAAQIVEFISGPVTTLGGTPNQYPRVSEATVDSIARIPDGHSLMVGGFFKEFDSTKENKVPLLGDIPLVGFFFKSKSVTKERASLVFVVTPTSYNPASHASQHKTAAYLKSKEALPRGHDWVNPNNPGPAHKSNWDRTMRGLKPKAPVCYPQQ